MSSRWAAPRQPTNLAAKSTANPHLITDADLAKVREHFSDAETAEIMQVICMANLFDRFTEALGLPLEDGIADGIKVSQQVIPPIAIRRNQGSVDNFCRRPFFIWTTHSRRRRFDH